MAALTALPSMLPTNTQHAQCQKSTNLGKVTQKNFIYGDKALDNAIALFLEVNEGAYLREPCTELQHH